MKLSDFVLYRRRDGKLNKIDNDYPFLCRKWDRTCLLRQLAEQAKAGADF